MKVTVVLLGIDGGSPPREALRLTSRKGMTLEDMRKVHRYFLTHTTVLGLDPQLGDDGTITYVIGKSQLNDRIVAAVRRVAVRALCQI